MDLILTGFANAMTQVGAIFTNFFTSIGELFYKGEALTPIGVILIVTAAIALGSGLLTMTINLFKRIGRR